jgi:hypothetical protein
MIWKLHIYLLFNPKKNISLEMQNQQLIFFTKDIFSVLCLFQDPLFLFVLSYLDIPIFFEKPILVLATFFFFVFGFLFGVNLSPKRTLKWWWCFGVILVLFIYFGFSVKLPGLTVYIFNELERGEKIIFFFDFSKLASSFRAIVKPGDKEQSEGREGSK